MSISSFIFLFFLQQFGLLEKGLSMCTMCTDNPKALGTMCIMVTGLSRKTMQDSVIICARCRPLKRPYVPILISPRLVPGQASQDWSGFVAVEISQETLYMHVDSRMSVFASHSITFLDHPVTMIHIVPGVQIFRIVYIRTGSFYFSF